MMLSVAIGVVVLGGCIFAAALVHAGRLVASPPSGRPRNLWVVLIVLLFLLIVGYAGYASIRWEGTTRISDLQVPFAFFGACLGLAVSILALANIQSVRRLVGLGNENITDPLTGIANYAYFTARLGQEVARSKRYQPPLSLLLIDVDRFKKIKDTYGDRVGDLVLAALAKLVLSIARNTDITARYAGEEIAVIVPNTSPLDAARFAERIRQAVETASLLPAEVNVGSNAVGVTVSIGVCSLSPHFKSDRALIAGAYAALLNAKEGGRNRVALR